MLLYYPLQLVYFLLSIIILRKLVHFFLPLQMMPEFKSEMRFSSYLPVCSTTKDLPVSGSSRQLLNNNQVQTFGHSRTWHHNDQVQIAGYGCNKLYPSSNASQLQDHLKEIVRKTMLEHEATFKHQVSG